MVYLSKSPAGYEASEIYFPCSNMKHSYEKVNARALESLVKLLKNWLPNGKIIGHEYVSLNPTRHDNKAGSFSINICTGAWADFAVGDKGCGAISLAAYLFNVRPSEAKYDIELILGMTRHA